MVNAAAVEPSPAFDPASVDAEGFAEELRALRRELDAALGPADLAHLRRIERVGRTAGLLGVLTAGLPLPLAGLLLSLARSTRWLLMHHIGHRGYDRVPGVPARYTSKGFARGARRFLDWPDWMLPEAWCYEHNVLHHSHTGEARDPDLIERNTEGLRASGWPLALRYGVMALLAVTWRSTYYAPNTMRAFQSRGGRARPARAWVALWLQCYAPYVLYHFVLLPALWLAFGWRAAACALGNSLLAEALTNVHTFCVVGPNHTGDDLYRFDAPASSRSEGLVRQVIGSVNFRCGGDAVDYAHLWLNYQIEHHLFPDLSMLQYRAAQPRVRALCAKYGVPYVQEGVLSRVRKMLAVAVGTASMRRAPEASAGAKHGAPAAAPVAA